MCCFIFCTVFMIEKEVEGKSLDGTHESRLKTGCATRGTLVKKQHLHSFRSTIQPQIETQP